MAILLFRVCLHTKISISYSITDWRICSTLDFQVKVAGEAQVAASFYTTTHTSLFFLFFLGAVSCLFLFKQNFGLSLFNIYQAHKFKPLSSLGNPDGFWDEMEFIRICNWEFVAMVVPPSILPSLFTDLSLIDHCVYLLYIF